MKRLKNAYHKLAYSPKTGGMLNYLTLKISDAEVERKLRILKAEQFNKIVLICAFFSVLNTLYWIFLYSTGKAPLFMALVSLATFLNQLVQIACKYFCSLMSAKTIIMYVLIHCVFTAAFYNNVFGDVEEYGKMGSYDLQIVTNFLYANSIQFNEIQLILF